MTHLPHSYPCHLVPPTQIWILIIIHTWIKMHSNWVIGFGIMECRSPKAALANLSRLLDTMTFALQMFGMFSGVILTKFLVAKMKTSGLRMILNGHTLPWQFQSHSNPTEASLLTLMQGLRISQLKISITKVSYPSSKKRCPIVLNIFTLLHMNCCGSLEKINDLFVCKESYILLLHFLTLIRSFKCCQGNLVAIFLMLLLCWCSGQMLHNLHHLATPSSGLSICFLEMNPNTIDAGPLRIFLNTWHTSRTWVVCSRLDNCK